MGVSGYLSTLDPVLVQGRPQGTLTGVRSVLTTAQILPFYELRSYND